MTRRDLPAGIDAGQLQAAEADLTSLRETMLALGRGEADAAELRDCARRCLHEHKTVFRTVAAAVGEELRRQLLDQLDAWRRQLDQQLPRDRGRPPH